MYIHDEEYYEAIDQDLEAHALDTATKHLSIVWENGNDKEIQDQSLGVAYLALVVAGKDYEAELVKKMGRLADEVERAVLALWLLGARLELPRYKSEWWEQSRDEWAMMIVGTALQNIEEMED